MGYRFPVFHEPPKGARLHRRRDLRNPYWRGLELLVDFEPDVLQVNGSRVSEWASRGHLFPHDIDIWDVQVYNRMGPRGVGLGSTDTSLIAASAGDFPSAFQFGPDRPFSIFLDVIVRQTGNVTLIQCDSWPNDGWGVQAQSGQTRFYWNNGSDSDGLGTSGAPRIQDAPLKVLVVFDGRDLSVYANNGAVIGKAFEANWAAAGMVPAADSTTCFGPQWNEDVDYYGWAIWSRALNAHEVARFLHSPHPLGLFATLSLPMFVGGAGAVVLSPNDIAQLQVPDSAGISQDHQISPAEIVQLQVPDSAGMSQDHQLSPAEIVQLQVPDSAAIGQDHQLSPAEVVQLHELGPATITVTGTLAPNDIAQLEALDAVAISQDHQLSPVSLAQLQALDLVVLDVSGSVTPAGIDQVHELGGVVLTQDHQLSPADLAQLQALGLPSVSIPTDYIPLGRAIIVAPRARAVHIAKRLRAMKVER